MNHAQFSNNSFITLFYSAVIQILGLENECIPGRRKLVLRECACNITVL